MKRIIQSNNAPRPIGPYSQATMLNNMLFVSGQIPIVPETGDLLEGNIQEQTKQVLENISAILKAAGMNFSDVMKCTLFIRDMTQFGQINEVYNQYFEKSPPARETVEVSRLPKDADIEISVIAMRFAS
jgi:2-iminobutanoate/2-iminopropanoate deaminase